MIILVSCLLYPKKNPIPIAKKSIKSRAMNIPYYIVINECYFHTKAARYLFLQIIRHSDTPKKTHMRAANPIPAPKAVCYLLIDSKN